MSIAATIDNGFAVIGIAVDATVLAGVVPTDVYAGGASTGGALVLVLREVQSVVSDSLKTFYVDAACVANAEHTEVDFLSTGI